MIRQIYFHDANYSDEQNWLSKSDVDKFLDVKVKLWRKAKREFEANAMCALEDFEELKEAIK